MAYKELGMIVINLEKFMTKALHPKRIHVLVHESLQPIVENIPFLSQDTKRFSPSPTGTPITITTRYLAGFDRCYLPLQKHPPCK